LRNLRFSFIFGLTWLEASIRFTYVNEVSNKANLKGSGRKDIMNLTQSTINFIKAREALEEAKQAEAQAVAELKMAFAQEGIAYNVVNGVKVSVTRKSRPTYSAEALLNMVSAQAFKKVTKAVIDAKKFKSACEVGVIKPEVAEAITSTTEYDEVRVTEITKGDETQVTVAA
jgi:hypothetical protein